MPAPNESDHRNRRFTFALTAAVAATTVAVGVTAATLLGWFRADEPPQATAAPPAEPAVVYVPIAPAAPEPSAVTADLPTPRLAMDEPREHRDDREGEREDDDD